MAGDYYFYVHDFTNSSATYSKAMTALSGAEVRVYKGSSKVPYKLSDGITDAVFKIDPSADGTLWKVFKLTFATAGYSSTASITKVDKYSYERNSENVGS